MFRFKIHQGRAEHFRLVPVRGARNAGLRRIKDLPSGEVVGNHGLWGPEDPNDQSHPVVNSGRGSRDTQLLRGLVDVRRHESSNVAVTAPLPAVLHQLLGKRPHLPTDRYPYFIHRG